MKFVEWLEGHWKGAATGLLIFVVGTATVLAQQTALIGPKTIGYIQLAGVLGATWLQMLKVDPTSRLAARLQAKKLGKANDAFKP